MIYNKWYHRRYLSKELKSCLRSIARDYNCKLRFEPRLEWGGSADLAERMITIPTHLPSIRQVLCSFFHELAHIKNMEDGKFPIYHPENGKDDFNNPHYYRTAWRAELYTDKVGKQLMAIYFPGIPYSSGYTPGNKETKAWFDKMLQEWKNDYKRSL